MLRTRRLLEPLTPLWAAARLPVAALLRDTLDMLLPQRCPACGVAAPASQGLCDACLAAIPRLEQALCAQCLLEQREPHGCRRHAGFQVHAAWIFDARAQEFIHALKYGARPALAAGQGEALRAALPARTASADLVLAMPHHASRLRERGFDASDALAGALARALPAPQVTAALVRRRATPPQAGRREHERRAAMTGAFRVAEPTAVAGRHVLLVDDVVTTGATFTAALTALREAGAEARGVALAWAP